jgi:hypothetical protein
MPNKCLARGYLEAQHDFMNTKRNVWLITIGALLLTVVFGVCGCSSSKISPNMGPHTQGGTPAPK